MKRRSKNPTRSVAPENAVGIGAGAQIRRLLHSVDIYGCVYACGGPSHKSNTLPHHGDWVNGVANVRLTGLWHRL